MWGLACFHPLAGKSLKKMALVSRETDVSRFHPLAGKSLKKSDDQWGIRTLFLVLFPSPCGEKFEKGVNP